MRVIAGRRRGTLLRVPPGSPIRPTADKLKAAMFSILEAEAYKRGVLLPEDAPPGAMLAGIAWPVVLDLYAGSGALGIEALSRGARWAEFVEHDPEARKVLRANLARTGFAEQAAVHALSAAAAVSTLRRRYDLILLDPPYGDPEAPQVFAALARSALFGPHSVVVWEHPRSLVPPAEEGALYLYKTRYHGASGVSIYLPRAPATGQGSPASES
jgi:16S rRNA (guanine966-N2)-methyltransferase